MEGNGICRLCYQLEEEVPVPVEEGTATSFLWRKALSQSTPVLQP